MKYYPKVTMKKLTTVVPGCMITKEWLERCKRKQAVQKQLHLLKPSLGLYNNEGKFRKDKWKAFKENYHVSTATLNALLTVPGDEFFTLVKMTSIKNKTIHELSLHTEELFKVFLESKGKYVKPRRTAYYRPYDAENDVLVDWDEGVWDVLVDWDEADCKHMKLGIMDLRDISTASNKDTAPANAPYFQEFLEMLSDLTDLGMT